MFTNLIALLFNNQPAVQFVLADPQDRALAAQYAAKAWLLWNYGQAEVARVWANMAVTLDANVDQTDPATR